MTEETIRSKADFHGIAAIVEAMRGGTTSSTAEVRRSLDVAETEGKRLSAFGAIDRTGALDAARDSERRWSAGRPRMLEGIPIVVKDLIDTAGIETNYGSAAYLGHIPATDATVVQTLRHQGAIVIGKATTHEFAWGVTTAGKHFGSTLNPRDENRIPGGSSGGTAVAIACGAVAAGLGTDTGGSVRIPAALCGVVGFKPTFGRLPSSGIFPLAPSLDHPGVLGASVEDVILLSRALGIRCGGASRRKARVSVIREVAPVPLEDSVAVSFEQVIGALEGSFHLSGINAPTLFDGVFAAFAGIVLTEGGTAHFARNSPSTIEAKYEPETVDRLERSRHVVLGDYAGWHETRRAFSRRLDLAMKDADFLILPTTPCVAPLHDQPEVWIGKWQGSVREALMTYTAPFNLAGYPAISLPMPVPPGVLPRGMQIVARPGEDAALLSIAREVERILANTMSA